MVLSATPTRRTVCGMSYEEELNKAIGERLQLVRTRAGLTQGELVRKLELLGITLAQQTIAKIEAGSRPLKLAEGEAVATVLGVALDDLVPSGEHSDEVYELRAGFNHFFDHVNRLSLQLSDLRDAQERVRKLWEEASDDARRELAASGGSLESMLTTPVETQLAQWIPYGYPVELKIR